MIVNQAFRYELDPNDRQRTLLAKHAGAARWAWNWALARRIEMFEKNEGKAKFTNAQKQHKELNRLKKTELPWMYETSKCAPQEKLRDLDKAFKAFWMGRKKGRKVGFPKFKRKGDGGGFRLYGAIRVEDDLRHVTLPRIGSIRVKESMEKFRGRILSATVRHEAERWFVSLCVERDRPDPKPVLGPVVGIDLGLDCFAVLSDGTRIESPKALERNLDRLRRRSKAHSRKAKGSNNRRKSAMWLAKLHREIRNIRTDAIHKMTTALAKTKSMIVVEDLAVRNMVRNRHLARSISDAGWAEVKRQLGYKCGWYGSELVTAPGNFPSTRRCSRCGIVGPRLDLSVRVFRCGSCSLGLDRDENAARNLEWYGQFGRNLPSWQKVCGDSAGGGTGSGTTRSTSHGSRKQKVNAVSSGG